MYISEEKVEKTSAVQIWHWRGFTSPTDQEICVKNVRAQTLTSNIGNLKIIAAVLYLFILQISTANPVLLHPICAGSTVLNSW